MSGCLSQSPYIMSNNIVSEEHHHSPNPLEKKGTTPNISSSSFINIINNTSIRRTFSADMSSQKWLENNGFPLKRVQSSEQLKVLGEEDGQNNVELSDNKGNSCGGPAFEDIWSSILSQKKPNEAGSGNKDPAPYFHPLMKRASSLSEKSLEICTESLGSETGSDVFSYPPSDPGEEEEEEEEQVKNNDHVEEMKGYVEVAKYSYNYQASNKKVSIGAPRSFPPPLPSLANRDDGSNLHMRTRRQDGRLVLEAVSVPSQNCFRARRQDGRLVLMLTNDDDEEQELDDDEVDDDDEVVVLDEKMSDDREVEEEIDQVEAVVSEDIVGNVKKKLALVAVEEASRLPNTRMVNVHRQSSAMLMNKLMELTANRNKSTRPRSSNRTIIKSLDDECADEDVPVLKKSVEVKTVARQKSAKCLPPRPRASTATAAADVMNAYEYYWRRSDSPAAAAVAVLKPVAGKQGNTASPQVVKDTTSKNKYLLARNGKRGAQQQQQQEEVVIVKAAGVGGAAGEKGEYLVPMLRGCKEPRRPPLLFWEPYCIATS